MNKKLRSKAIQLRLQKAMSYSAIKKALGVSKSTLSYWLKDYPLTKEKISELQKSGWSTSEISREKYRATMRETKEKIAEGEYVTYKKVLGNIGDKALFVSGLMLYSAEGDKKNSNRICLANTDTKLIFFFMSWLTKFYEVDRSTIKFQLHLYEDMDVKKEKEYWRGELSVEDVQFYKPSIRKVTRNSFSYSESYRHGTCSLYVLNTRKKTQLMMAIKAFLELYKDI